MAYQHQKLIFFGIIDRIDILEWFVTFDMQNSIGKITQYAIRR
jgi:hypothetical protein